jgi:hypothetical protein
MATQGLRANNSEYLRSILDDGEPCFYGPNPTFRDVYFPGGGYPAIHIRRGDKDLLFVDHGDTFQIVDVSCEDENYETIDFSYDRCDNDIKMFMVAAANYELMNAGITLDGRRVCMGYYPDPGCIVLQGCNGICELVSKELIYLFDDVESYLNKVKHVVERMNAETEEFSKDRFVALMTERRCKSARK